MAYRTWRNKIKGLYDMKRFLLTGFAFVFLLISAGGIFAMDKDLSTRIIKNGTPIILIIGNTKIPATLNDSLSSQELIKRLPFTMKLRKYAHDYCGVMQNPLPYDEKDVHNGWLNGDIDFARDGNYFTILYEDEENSKQYGHQINLGKVDGPLSAIKSMGEEIEITIEKLNKQ